MHFLKRHGDGRRYIGPVTGLGTHWRAEVDSSLRLFTLTLGQTRCGGHLAALGVLAHPRQLAGEALRCLLLT